MEALRRLARQCDETRNQRIEVPASGSDLRSRRINQIYELRLIC